MGGENSIPTTGDYWVPADTEALSLFRKLGHRLNQAIGLCNLGQVALHEDDLELAQRLLNEALELARQVSSPEQEAECELLLGEVALEAGRPAHAQAHFERSLAICRDSADKRGAANALWRLGETSLAAGDYGGARACLTDALAEFRDAEMWKELLGCLEDFTALAQWAGLDQAALRIAAVVMAARQRLGLLRRPTVEGRWQLRLEALGEQVGNERFVATWKETSNQWEIEDAIRCALALPEAADPALVA